MVDLSNVSVTAKAVSAGPGLYHYNAETKTWTRQAGRHYYPTIGERTRARLASAPQGELGRWERTCNLQFPFWALSALSKYLPPECVSPSNHKVRSHRRGLAMQTLIDATDLRKDAPWWPDEDRLRELLERSTEEIETIANMKRLARLAARGA